MKKSLLILAFVFPSVFCLAQKDSVKAAKPDENACKITVAGIPPGGEIALQTLLSAKGISFADTAACKMIIFNYKIGNYTKDENIFTQFVHADFTAEAYDIFKTLKPGDSFTIFDIVVKPKGKKLQTLAGGKFTVK